MNIKAKKLCISGISIAVYIVVLYFTQPVSFGQYQIRVATSIYSLVYVFDFLCIPLALANLLSNLLFGSLGILDVIGGFIVGVVTTRLICLLKKIKGSPMFCCLPIAVAPTIIVPLWLHYILKIQYIVLLFSMLPGQIISSLIGAIIIIPIAKFVRQTDSA